mgnify:CR=1 FL=1
MTAEIFLQPNLEKYRFLYESAPVGLYRITISDGIILECNQYMVRMFGYLNSEEISPQLKFSENSILLEEREKFLSGLDGDGKFQNCKKNRALFWECATIEPIKNEKGS